jgi:dihydrofolate reductase
MGNLVYAALTSLDGYVSDPGGNFDWAEPGEDVHRYINGLEARSSLNLFGRKMYEVLSVWENLPDAETLPAYIREYEALWKGSRKIVFSSTLASVVTAKTTVRRSFDRKEIEKLKKEESGTIGIGGATLATRAFDLGLVDEVYLFQFPVCIGAGKKWIGNEEPLFLGLIETREFEDGVLMVHYSCDAAKSRE